MINFGSFLTKLKRILVKIKVWLLRMFLILTNSTARKKFFDRLRIKKEQKLHKELEVSISIEEEIAPKTLWHIYHAATKVKEDMRQKALQLFLEHKNLWHDDIYDAVEDVSPEDREMINTFWNKDLEIGLNEEQLAEIIRKGPQNFQDLAYNELLVRIVRIKGGKTRKPQAEEILRTLMNDVPSRRIPLWQFLKTIKPSSVVLEKLLESHWLYSLPKIEKEIRELITKVRKQEREQIEKIKKTDDRVKKAIKQLQKLE